MNRDEIWQHINGTHWRILATDLDPTIWPIAAVCTRMQPCVIDVDVGQVNRFDRSAFVRQVREPREFTIALHWESVKGAFAGRWPEDCPEALRGCAEYIRVREVLDDQA